MDSDMAIMRAENEALRAQLGAIKPRKRKRVNTDPNTTFAGIGTIRRAQISAGAIDDEPDDSSEDGESSDASDCIVVVVKSRK